MLQRWLALPAGEASAMGRRARASFERRYTVAAAAASLAATLEPRAA
jgi:hypothetical protein